MDKQLRGKALAKALNESAEWFFVFPNRRALHRFTVRNVVLEPARSIRKIRDIGIVSVRLIEKELERVGLHLGMTEAELAELCQEPDYLRENLTGLVNETYGNLDAQLAERGLKAFSTTVPPTVTLTLSADQLVSMLAKAVAAELIRMADEDDAE